MSSNYNKIIGLLEQKKDLLEEYKSISQKQLEQAVSYEWTAVIRSSEQIEALVKEIDLLDKLLADEDKMSTVTDIEVSNLESDGSVSHNNEKFRRRRVLEGEIVALLEEAIQLQKQSVIPITKAREQALRELQALGLRVDAAKAYQRPIQYYRSEPKYIDKEK